MKTTEEEAEEHSFQKIELPKPIISFYDEDGKQVGRFDYTDPNSIKFEGDLEKAKKIFMEAHHLSGFIIFWEWVRKQERELDLEGK